MATEGSGIKKPMGTNQTDDFFRDVYRSELEHKYKLDSVDGFLAVLLIALASVGIYYGKLLPSCGFGMAGYFFLVFSILFFIAFGIGVVFVIASFLPLAVREYIGHPQRWSDYLDSLKDYHAYGGQLSEEEVKDRVAKDWEEALRQKYINAGETNFNFNFKKMAYQARAKWCIGVAIVVMMFNALPTYYVQCAKTDTQKTEVISFPDVQKVKIVDPQQ